MTEKSKPSDLKSAYELALERLESQGIERPRGDAFSEETRHRMAEVRKRAESELAQLEILHKKRLREARDPSARKELEDEYVRERRRIEDRRERDLEKLRKSGTD